MVIVIINLLGLFMLRARIKGGLRTEERKKEVRNGKRLLFLPSFGIRRKIGDHGA